MPKLIFSLSGSDPEKESQIHINMIFRIQDKGMHQLKHTFPDIGKKSFSVIKMNMFLKDI